MHTKKKNVVKLVLDIAMGITFALLFNKRVLGGLAFHEIAGIAIGFAVLIHILLNLKFVQKITTRLFNRSLPHRTRLGYLLNVLLLISMGFIIVSGLLISKVVLPSFRFGNENWFKMSHMSISYLALVLIGIHIGLHWHWVVTMFQRFLPLRLPKAASKFLMIAMAALVVIYGGYQIYTTQFITKLEMVQNVFQASSAPGGIEHGGMEGKPGAGGGQKPASGSSAPEGKGQRPEGQPGGGPGGGEGQRGGEGPGGGANFLSVILTYFGIMGVFAAFTYYADKWIALGRKRMRLAKA